MHIHHLGKFLHNILEPLLQFRLTNNFFPSLNGRGLAFNVRQDGCDLWNFRAHLPFEACHFIVRLLHTELLVEFQMLLHVQLAVQILHADVVNVKVMARGHGADAIENIFRAPSARHGVHHHVGLRQNLAHA